MNKIVYKKAAAKDLGGFFRFFKASIREYFPEYTKKTREFFIKSDYSEKSINDYLKNGESLYLAVDQKKTVGYLFAGKPEGGVSFLYLIAVDSNYRNRGIAKKLLEIWEEDILKRGAHCLLLTTEKRNSNFYKKMGFTFMGFLAKGYYGVGDFWFYKTIQEPKEKNYLRS